MGLFRKRPAGPDPSRGPTRLHIGCGQQAMAGWINIDNQRLPGVDQVLDVRNGLPFSGVAAIYAEHFLEHLVARRRPRVPAGVPARPLAGRHPAAVDAEPRLGRLDPLSLGRRHRERARARLHSLEPRLSRLGPPVPLQPPHARLGAAAAGFAQRRRSALRGERVPELRGLERHETWDDTPEPAPRLVVEASGHGAPRDSPGRPHAGASANDAALTSKVAASRTGTRSASSSHPRRARVLGLLGARRPDSSPPASGERSSPASWCSRSCRIPGRT